MITCYVKYVIDPYKVKEFKEYGKIWIRLVNKLGVLIRAISFHMRERTQLFRNTCILQNWYT